MATDSTTDCTCPEGTGRGWAFTTVVADVPQMFVPDVANSRTPEESSGFGWFTKAEIAKLNLHPGFADAWRAVTQSRQNATIKCAVRRVDISGQVTWEHPDPCPCHNAPGGGLPLKTPHDANDIYQPQPGQIPCEDNCLDSSGRTSLTRGGGTAEHTDDMAGVRRQKPIAQPGDAPVGGNQDDTEFVERDHVATPNQGIMQGYMGGHWPAGGHATTGNPPVTAIGGATGQGPTAASLGRNSRKGGVAGEKLADAASVVTAQLMENFPAQALEWVPQAEWSGPELVPLDMVDFHDMESWAAWHETDRVEHFERAIEAGEEINPVVMIKVPGHEHYRAVDGHHRTLAYLRLGRPVLAWVGKVPFGLEHIALETHSSQEAQGSAEGNQ